MFCDFDWRLGNVTVLDKPDQRRSGYPVAGLSATRSANTFEMPESIARKLLQDKAFPAETRQWRATGLTWSRPEPGPGRRCSRLTNAM